MYVDAVGAAVAIYFSIGRETCNKYAIFPCQSTSIQPPIEEVIQRNAGCDLKDVLTQTRALINQRILDHHW